MEAVYAIIEACLSILTSLLTVFITVGFFVRSKENPFLIVSLPLAVLFLSFLLSALVFIFVSVILILLATGMIENSPKHTVMLVLSLIIGHSIATFCDLASVGVFVQRIVNLLFPLKVFRRSNQAIVAFVVVVSLIASSFTFYFNLQSYKIADPPFREGCYAFNCLDSLGLPGRTANLIVRCTGALSMIVSGCLFVAVYRRTKLQNKSIKETNLNKFVKCMFLLRSVMVLTYYIPEYIVKKTIGVNLSDFIGPYVMLLASIDGFLSMFVYCCIVIKNKKKVVVVSLANF